MVNGAGENDMKSRGQRQQTRSINVISYLWDYLARFSAIRASPKASLAK